VIGRTVSHYRVGRLLAKERGDRPGSAAEPREELAAIRATLSDGNERLTVVKNRKLRPTVKFCRSRDGVRLAYSTVGEGPALLRTASVPTLVLHARGEAGVPFECGREMASLIPGARLVALDSDHHILLPREPAYARFMDEVTSFLRGA
jgi:pimeloyl-ACP methyl ester carboxylesterase